MKRRPGDQRSALLELLEHPNMHVRFNVATALIGIVPVRAREVIQAIVDLKVFLLAGHAGTYLSLYDGELSDLLRKKP